MFEQLLVTKLDSVVAELRAEFTNTVKVLEVSFFLAEVDRWKAAEFLQFLLYSGIVVVKGKLSDIVYQHFWLLVVDMFCLCVPCIAVRRLSAGVAEQRP